MKKSLVSSLFLYILIYLKFRFFSIFHEEFEYVFKFDKCFKLSEKNGFKKKMKMKKKWMIADFNSRMFGTKRKFKKN